MRFYTRQHRHYCGVDLHARTHVLSKGGRGVTSPLDRLEPGDRP